MLQINKGSVLGFGAIIIGIMFAVMIPKLVENLDASEIMVIQYPMGELKVFTEPGPQAQWFGTVTKYPRRDQYSFSAAKDQGATTGDQSIKTGFNDGGTGHISGVVSWEMPLKPDAVIRLHKEYGSFKAIDQQLIRPMLEKVIFSAGATMSSIESSSERKPEIPQSIDDQLQNGPYLTKVAVANIKDPMTGQMKTVKTVQIATDDHDKPIRASASTIKEYGITLSPVTVNDIVYEESVRNQIAERQKSTQAVQLSQAAAIKATQDTITTEQQGRASAAKAKWTQETENAKDIALAEKNKQVALLNAQAAEQYKKRMILEGEGDGAKARLIMQANGALEQKLATYKEVNALYADALAKHEGPLVPSTIIGGSNGGGSGSPNSVTGIMDMFMVKTAKELGLDMSMKK